MNDREEFDKAIVNTSEFDAHERRAKRMCIAAALITREAVECLPMTGPFPSENTVITAYQNALALLNGEWQSQMRDDIRAELQREEAGRQYGGFPLTLAGKTAKPKSRIRRALQVLIG